jgi:hypothetical protein
MRRAEIVEESPQADELLSSRLDALTLQIVQLREEVRVDVCETRASLNTLRDELQQEIRNGDEEIRRCIRVLHELVVARMAALREGRSPRR